MVSVKSLLRLVGKKSICDLSKSLGAKLLQYVTFLLLKRIHIIMDLNVFMNVILMGLALYTFITVIIYY